MLWLLFLLALFTLLASFYHIKLTLFSVGVLSFILAFYYSQLITSTSFFVLFIPFLLFFILINFKKIRQQFITKTLFKALELSNNQEKSFIRIDNGWFASDFEIDLFRGKPDFSKTLIQNLRADNPSKLEQDILAIIHQKQKTRATTKINMIVSLGGASFILDHKYNGQSLTAAEFSSTLKNLSKASPVMAALLGIINLDSLISFIHYFGSLEQKKNYLPKFAKAKLLPFLKPTSLYENLDSQKSSIEGRIEKNIIKGEEVTGIRLSFQDVILLGTSKSNCFYLNVNIKDFNNIIGDKTHLGTAICILDNEIKGLVYKKGLTSYNGYLNYYSCTGNNVFIPFEHVVNERNGIGNGLEYLYKNQYLACNIWPLAISIPTNNTATLTAWYFAHLQKQNGRQLLSYRLVLSKLNEQFSQCLKIQLLDKLSLQDTIKPTKLKFIAILNKNSHITKTMEQLALLRNILGSNSHNIKTESKVRSFYKVAHLATELDGMSQEINQLPLIKKAALACHPYYSQEVKLLIDKDPKKLDEFDKIIFQHIGYIIHNLSKTWVYTLRTSFVGRLFFQTKRYHYMIKRMSSSFAFLSDITLILWTFKETVNTSFASQLGKCLQNLTTAIALHDYYLSKELKEQTKDIAKYSLKNTLYDCQNSLKNTINLAFKRFPSFIVKFLIFPFGKPYYPIKVFKSLHSDIEQICSLDIGAKNPYSKYSPFLQKIYQAKQKLKAAESAEIAVTNATGTPLNTDNYEVLINRCLAAGIVSVEQSEQLREAYQSILEIKLTNHFGNHYEK